MTGDQHPAVVEDRFRTRAERRKAWGIGLLIAAGLCWGYAAFQLFTPYETRIWSVHCSGPAVADREGLYDFDGPDGETARRKIALCAEQRDWPAPVTALLIGAPLAAVGGSLRAAGSVALDLREHAADLARAER
ncbi:hypothetical protein ACIREE_06960 [Streptomyces sp. NPDC102467]|uniref:hypothetical protein n=1 Tax=Streptomyces sp. NPDC102467 TaxID=3366179 RepID=UPI00381676E6